jgi:hypothetical protein
MDENLETTDIAVSSPSEAFNAEISTSTNPDNDVIAKRIQEARKQEKEKLYPQLEKLQEEISSLRKEREELAAVNAERNARRAEREAQRAAEKKAQQEEEMSFKQLLKTKEQEFQSQLEAERLERERTFALLQREREYQELKDYRIERLNAERDNIMPELLDLISGNSKEEIEQSILSLKERTAKILDSVSAATQQATQQNRKEMVGTRITVPASGPLDNDSSSNTPLNVSDMSMADYIKNRDRLLRSSSNNRGQGLFG